MARCTTCSINFTVKNSLKMAKIVLKRRLFEVGSEKDIELELEPTTQDKACSRRTKKYYGGFL